MASQYRNSVDGLVNSNFPNGIFVKHWDKFCWMCHKTYDDMSAIQRCSKCTIVYHTECLSYTIEDEHNLLWKCSECEQVAESLTEERNMENIHKSLKCAMKSINRQIKFKIPAEFNNDKSPVYPITLENIMEKVERNEYSCTKSFELDFEWLLHNFIIWSKQRTHKIVGGNKVMLGVKKLLELCQDEISYLKGCGDCYIRGPHQFVLTCSKPHLLLWVKLGDYPYWPAKLMRIGNGQTPIEIVFFGDFESAAVSSGNCLLFSKSNPNKCVEKTESWNKAISDANKHIKGLEERFGTFNFAPKNCPFDTADLEQHLADMLPDYREPNKTDQTTNDEIAFNEQIMDECDQSKLVHVDVTSTTNEEIAFNVPSKNKLDQPELEIIDLTNEADALRYEYYPNDDEFMSNQLSNLSEPKYCEGSLEQEHMDLKVELKLLKIECIKNMKRRLKSKKHLIKMYKKLK